MLVLPEIEAVSDLYERLKAIITQPAIPEKADYVRVMSLHKSKGLTSQVAIVSGCSQGLIPFVDRDVPPAEAKLINEEQRRLFYVAITRCTEILVVSSFRNIPRQLAWKLGALVAPGAGSIGRTVASQFIDELGPTAPATKIGSAWAQAQYSE